MVVNNQGKKMENSDPFLCTSTTTSLSGGMDEVGGGAGEMGQIKGHWVYARIDIFS